MRYLLSEIAAVCEGRLSGCDTVVSRVITDSRTFPVNGGTLFVAIRTANRDGAAYIDDLYARGVRGFLVGDGFGDAAQYPEAGFVAVPDTVKALQALAAHYRAGFTGKVVGITGSYGKTTVKEWIAQLAPAGVRIFRSPKSWNSQIGAPLSVLMAEGTEDYTVIEAGISEPGEMAALQRIIRPDIGILTSVGGAHEENFVSREHLRDEKMILFHDCSDLLDGTDLTQSSVKIKRHDTFKGWLPVKLGESGADNFVRRNTLLAITFWRREGYDIPEAAVEKLEPVAMRLEVREGLYNSVIVNDTHRSDIHSIAIAIDYLAMVAGERRRIVIMPHGNADAARLVKASGVERLIEISSEHSIDDVLRSLAPADLQDRAILIKGGARLGFDRISRSIEHKSHTTVMEVDLDAVIHNLRLCRQHLAPGVGVTPMIKASGYGHGTFEMARTLQGQGVDYLAVAFADEGVALRESGITMPIVVLNADADSFEPMIRHRLEPEIYNFVSFGEFTALLKRHGEAHHPVHLKLDTGMHRLGFRVGELPALIDALAAADRWVRVATIFSHLAAADDPAQDEFTRRQIADFDRMSSQLAAVLPYPVKRHIANTNGIERFPEAQFDMVRLGIGLYGFGMPGARPVASLRTRIVHIASLQARETVGYGRRGVLERPSRIATIPIGYADGLNRHLGNGRWSVLIGGKPAPIVGNVCMDSCMIDITDIPGGREGDEATIFSARPGNTAEDMAAALATIPYEVLTGVSSRVKRIYTKE